MASSFVAYIDESGDDGFVFNADGSGSSKWIAISAVVIRKEREKCIIEIARKARELIGKPINHALHFMHLKHEQRIAVTSLIATTPIRTITILAHKPSIPDPEKYQTKKNRLYHYLCRLLIERVSWLCREHYKEGFGDRTADLIFSNRASMSYDELRAYIETLQEKSVELGVEIDWNVINPQQLQSEKHEKMAGLQIADFAASGIRYAAELTRYGHAEPGHLKKLRWTMYRRKSVLFGYGLKFYPDLKTLKPSNPHLAEFDGL